MISALLSVFHLFALALGLPAVFFRGRALRDLAADPGAVHRVLAADNLWGVAALLWLSTGLARAFGPWDKGSGYYLHSGSFLVKLGLFGLIFALELWPMITFIRWRVQLRAGRVPDLSRAATFARLNTAELVLTLAIPFFAAAMARGLGAGWFS